MPNGGSARAWLKRDPELGSGRPNRPTQTSHSQSKPDGGSARAWLKRNPELGSGRPNGPTQTWESLA